MRPVMEFAGSGARPSVVGSPRRHVPNAILGTLIFLAAEAMMFAGLVSAFLVLRSGVEAWPPPGQPRFPIPVTVLNTAVLLASGFTMLRARSAAIRGAFGRVPGMLGLTGLLGIVFVAVQGIEWARLVSHGMQVAGGIYGGLFCAIIGTHAVHVVGGVVVVQWAWRRARMFRGRIAIDQLTAATAYWLFVVGVWPILFWLVYLR